VGRFELFLLLVAAKIDSWKWKKRLFALWEENEE